MSSSQTVESATAKRSRDLTRRRLSLIPLVLILLAAFSGTPYLAEQLQYAITRGRQRAEADVARVRLETLDHDGDVFRMAARCVGPSVVQIDSVLSDARDQVSAAADDSNPEPEDEASGDQAVPSRPWLERPEPDRTAGQGTGVIIDDAGYVLTNYHVVSDASTILVRLSDGRVIRGAELIGFDAPTDLALLKIEAGSLTAAEWGDSEQLDVGDWVLAVGNPFGLDRSVTAGIVSATRRRGVILGTPYQNLLQTDAAVNPGNSGGPLVNLRGEVVGINTAILGRTYQGVSFAIPSDVAQQIYEQLRKEGAVERGWLGVALDEVTPKLAERLDLPQARGAVVTRILPGTPAERAGLREGDVVVAWNSEAVDTPEDLSYEVARCDVGQKASVRFFREGVATTADVTVGRRPAMR